MIFTVEQNKRRTDRDTQTVSGKQKREILKELMNKGAREEGRQTDLT